MKRSSVAEIGAILLVAALPASVSYTLNPPTEVSIGSRISTHVEIPSGHLSIEAVLKRVQSGETIRWIDARSEAEFSDAHIEGATLLNFANWESQFGDLITDWMPDETLVVYCGSEACGASKKVAERLQQELGIENVWVLHGGWNAWQGRDQDL
ncbi:MAG: hypothetical protein SynsKO_04220 [Synoicihabitans sp.]